jgi:hypothetical protein
MAGKVSLWRYRERARNYPGFHLSADRLGCDQLLTLLSSLMKARTPRIGNVALDPVTPAMLAIPNNRDAAISAYRHWALVVDPGFPPERLHFTVTNDRVQTELSVVQAESVADGVRDIRERRGDYAIGDEEDHQLWFWWQDAV